MKRCQCGAKITNHVERCMRCRQAHRRDREPTMEELDALEAEQRKNPPGWWKDEVPHGEGDE